MEVINVEANKETGKRWFSNQGEKTTALSMHFLRQHILAGKRFHFSCPVRLLGSQVMQLRGTKQNQNNRSKQK